MKIERKMELLEQNREIRFTDWNQTAVSFDGEIYSSVDGGKLEEFYEMVTSGALYSQVMPECIAHTLYKK